MGRDGQLTDLLTPILVVGKVASASAVSGTTTLVMVAVAVAVPVVTWLTLGVWSRRRRRPTTA